MFQLRFTGIAALLFVAQTACSAAVGDGGSEEGGSTDRENAAAISQAVVDNQFAVGVIPIGGGGAEGGLYGTTCPADSSLVSIYMDDEDHLNGTGWGWSWKLPQDSTPGYRFRWDGYNTPMKSPTI